MADVLSKGSLFPPELVKEMINTVKGRSALAALSGQTPIPFNGLKEFIFSLDKEIDIVAENGKKTAGGATIEPKTIVPVKFEYSMRVSDEFVFGSEEVQLNYLSAFSEGFAKKVAKGFDIAAMYGVNPRTGLASEVVGTNSFDKQVTQTVNYAEATPDDNVDAAVAVVQGSEGDVNGIAMASEFAAALAKIKVNGVKQYPELAWGGNPASINGLPLDVNNTVSFGTSKDVAIVGDFANTFKWGYAKEMPLEVIPYGDPDNTGVDLKGSNQVCLRSEVYIGWGILIPNSFARIVKETTP